MKDVHDGLGVKNMSDLVLKKIHSKYLKKTLQMNKLKNQKWLKDKYDKISENELNKKARKESTLEIILWLLS